MAVKTGGSLYGTGYNYYGQLGLADNTNRNVFTKISEGWKRKGQLAIGTSGDATNRNEFDSISQSVPNRGVDTWEFVVCGDEHTMAIRIIE